MKLTTLLSLFFLGYSLLLGSPNSDTPPDKIDPRIYNVGLVAFYNLENLFDTIDDENVDDSQFLPKGSYAWTGTKYKNKIHNMALAISQIGTIIEGKRLHCPAILGLCEIENIGVTRDLVNDPILKPYNFGIVHYESGYYRGVDVALIYQKDHFKVLNSVPYVYIDSTNLEYKTRDQLLVSGIFMEDTLHIIVNHWPSRFGGEKRSAPKRAIAARLSRHIADSLLNANPKANIIVMGDFNDDPKDKSVNEILQAPHKRSINPSESEFKSDDLVNLTSKMYNEGVGTLCYRGVWNLFDQIVVSQNLLGNDRNSIKTSETWTGIFNSSRLKQQEGPYSGYPLRTHAGGVYLNGYSDHFPVYAIFVKKK